MSQKICSMPATIKQPHAVPTRDSKGEKQLISGKDVDTHETFIQSYRF